VRRGGGLRSKNVGISSHKTDEKSVHQKPKVSWAMIINPGLGDPNRSDEDRKGMEEQVNIPALLYFYPMMTYFKGSSMFWLYMSPTEKSGRSEAPGWSEVELKKCQEKLIGHEIW
jgi:hypothetical protein